MEPFWTDLSNFVRRGLWRRSWKVRRAAFQRNSPGARKWSWRNRVFAVVRQNLYSIPFRQSYKILLSSTLLAAFDWEKERIKFESIRDELGEFDLIKRLKGCMLCVVCAKKVRCGNGKVEGIEYCTCERKQDVSMDGWEPYIERDNMTTWRREEKPGHYAYKVHVCYPDVSVEDFLYVQTNIDYRRKWDDTAIELRVIDSEDRTNSQVIYWEMLWPKLFNNRDYVYMRRYFIDSATQNVVIVNRSTEHPRCPETSGKQRVREYFSNMVIKPLSGFNKPGLEFVLTYYDDPGLSIPKSITTWVAQRQMPEFLEKLHQATLSYAREKELREKNKFIWKSDPGFEYPNLEQESLSEETKDEFDGSFNDAPEEESKSWFSLWIIKKLLFLV